MAELISSYLVVFALGGLVTACLINYYLRRADRE